MTDVLWVLLGLMVTWVVSLVASLCCQAEMYVRLTRQLGEIKELMPEYGPPQPQWATHMEKRLTTRLEKIMALVQIEDTVLTHFATTVETEVAAIGTAVGVLQGYIAQLVAGQGTPLPAADETALNQALTDLSASVGNLNALEPVTPTP